MRYSIEDPFVLYYGDFILYRAAFVELVCRKVLDDNGFPHKHFTANFSPDDPNGSDAVYEALEFLEAVMTYMGYVVHMPDIFTAIDLLDSGLAFKIKIALPELKGFNRYQLNKHRQEWIRVLSVSKFYEMPFDVAFQLTKDKDVNLVLSVHEDIYFAWPGVADFVFNFCEFRKGIKEVLKEHEGRTDSRELGSDYPLSAK